MLQSSRSRAPAVGHDETAATGCLPAVQQARKHEPDAADSAKFELDLEHCPNCGELTTIAAILGALVMEHILGHFGLPAPPRAPACAPISQAACAGPHSRPHRSLPERPPKGVTGAKGAV